MEMDDPLRLDADDEEEEEEEVELVGFDNDGNPIFDDDPRFLYAKAFQSGGLGGVEDDEEDEEDDDDEDEDEEDDEDEDDEDEDEEDEEEGESRDWGQSVPPMSSRLEQKYDAFESDIDINDIKRELQDQDSLLSELEKTMTKKGVVSKADIDQAKSALPSIFGNVEDLQYELDGLAIETEDDRLKRKSLMVDIEVVFSRIQSLEQLVGMAAAKLSDEHRIKGNEFFKVSNWVAAIKSYDVAISLEPENSVLYTNRALAKQKNDLVDEAIIDSKKAISLDASSLKGYVILIKSLLAKGQLSAASDIFSSIPFAYSTRPEVTELHGVVAARAKEQGNTHFKAGQLDEAVRMYSIAILNDSTNHLLYSNRSAAFQSKKLWEKAATDAEASLRLNESFAKGFVHLGRCQVQLKRWSEAVASVQKARDTLAGDELATIQSQLSEILEGAEAGRAGRLTAAQQAARMNVSAASEAQRVESLKERGNELYKEEEYQEAIRYYSQAIALSPSEGSIYGNRAAAWLMLKEFKRAAADCDEGIKHEKTPGQLDKLRLRKATAMGNFGDIAGAVKYLLEAIAAIPASAANFDKTVAQFRAAQQNCEAGLESLGKSEFSRAKRLFQQASTILADNPAIRLGSARCHLGLGEFDDASREAQKVISATGGVGQTAVDAYLCRAQALQSTGATDLASKHLAAALQMDPDNQAIQQKVKALRRIIAETTRVRDEIDKALNKSDFEKAIRFCADGLQIDKDSRKLMSEMHYRRAFAFSKMAKAQARAPAAAASKSPSSLSSEADDVSSPKKLSEVSWKRVLQDINSAVYFDTTPAGAAVPYVFLKCEALQALGRFEESVNELEQCYSNGAGKEERSVREKLQEAQFALKKSKRVDLYAILGVARGEQATEAEIKTAYKKSALRWHPDRHSSGSEADKKNAEAKFKTINDAYEVLTDPQRKRLWDQGYDRAEIEEKLEQEKQRQQYGGHGHGHGHGRGHGW